MTTNFKTLTGKFDNRVVNAVLKGIVDETPAGTRYVNPNGDTGKGTSCYYTDHENQPSCLIGRVIARLGLPLPKETDGDNSNSVRYLAVALNNFTDSAIDRMVTVQRRQDDGETWKRAIR